MRSLSELRQELHDEILKEIDLSREVTVSDANHELGRFEAMLRIMTHDIILENTERLTILFINYFKLNIYLLGYFPSGIM